MNTSIFKVPTYAFSEKAMNILLIHGFGLLFVLAFSSVNAVCEKNEVTESVGVAMSFGYPVSEQLRQDSENDEGWYVTQDFQDSRFHYNCSFNEESKAYTCYQEFKPYRHLGEDWSFAGDSGSGGKSVVAVANGCVINKGVSCKAGATDKAFCQIKKGWGWAGYVVLKHYLPNGSYIYSLYGHLQPQSLPSEGTFIQKGKPFARLATDDEMDIYTEFGAHLHFEMRDAEVGYDNGSGYEKWEAETTDGYNIKGYYDPTDVHVYKLVSSLPFGGKTLKAFYLSKEVAAIPDGLEDADNNSLLGFIDIALSKKSYEDFLCTFPDVENLERGEYKDAINTLCTEGIIKGFGNGTFGPNQNVTRAQFSKIVILTKLVDEKGVTSGYLPDTQPTDKISWEKTLLEINADNEKEELKAFFEDEISNQNKPFGGFIDVDHDLWYFEYVNTLGALGTVQGYGLSEQDCQDYFSSDWDNCQKKLKEFAKLRKNQSQEDTCKILRVSDSDCERLEQLKGRNQFKPENPITRAEMIKMVLKGIVGLEDIPNRDQAQPQRWSFPYMECALDKTPVGKGTKQLLLLDYNTEDEMVKMGYQHATRAETAYAVHRVRQLCGDNLTICGQRCNR